VSGGLQGARTEPRREFTRNVLGDEAARADGRADWPDGYLQRGDALAVLVGQLEPLPEAAETVAAWAVKTAVRTKDGVL
jgi:hypothetical protein